MFKKTTAGRCAFNVGVSGFLLALFLALAVVSVPLVRADTAGEIVLEDASGVTVTLPAPARRVISLAPHITETLFAAGAGAHIVGTVSYSDFPEAARSLPRVGSYDSVSYESVVALRPDLIIAWRSGSGSEAVERLRSLGIPVYVDEPRALDDVARSLRIFGRLTGEEASAEQAAQRYLTQLKALRERYASEAPLSVYYQIWNEPLLTLNGDHLISDVLRVCGGRNVFGDALALVSRISVESVIRADPQVIIASGMDKARPEWLDDWRRWSTMTAVRNDQLYFVPPDILQRHTPRIVEGASAVCEHLAQARLHYAPEAGR